MSGEPEDSKPKLNLVISHSGTQITVKVKANMQFKKIFEVAEKRFGKDPGTLRFVYDGRRWLAPSLMIYPSLIWRTMSTRHPQCFFVLVLYLSIVYLLPKIILCLILSLNQLHRERPYSGSYTEAVLSTPSDADACWDANL
ncbi:hypothetical protein F5888DRAFT_505466 [Russula emetica]|nr:hypothetical protein F5888DRAFT_505466 [Russula emetica]